MPYTIRKAQITPRLDADFNDPAWAAADTLEITHAHPKSSPNRPLTRVRMLYGSQGLYVSFRVIDDRQLLCIRNAHQEMVCNDTAVELFLQPPAGVIPPGDSDGRYRGYFNFEVNCGGWMLARYNDQIDPTIGQARRSTALTEEAMARIPIYHSMPPRIEPELAGPVTWRIAMFIPFTTFESVLGEVLKLNDSAGWRGNVYKINQESKVGKHWITWAPIGEELNFHRPQRFDAIRFEA